MKQRNLGIFDEENQTEDIYLHFRRTTERQIIRMLRKATPPKNFNQNPTPIVKDEEYFKKKRAWRGGVSKHNISYEIFLVCISISVCNIFLNSRYLMFYTNNFLILSQYFLRQRKSKAPCKG